MRSTDQTGTCVITHHPHTGAGLVCPAHLDTLDSRLHALPRHVAALAALLVPGGPTPPGHKVSRARVGSPTPARLDVLSLIGPGTATVRGDKPALVPLVRTWSTVETVTVTVPGVPPRTEQRRIRIWHRDPVPDHTTPPRVCACGQTHPTRPRPRMVPDHDQLGVVPPLPWARMWATRWRHLLHTPTPTTERPPVEVPDTTLTHDPLATEWAARYGRHAPTAAAVAAATAELRDLLPLAADHPTSAVAEFAAELHALVRELELAAGMVRDDYWVGRCPVEITAPDGATRPCGAGLWQDPWSTRIECPRCHTAWHEREWLGLAARIRAVWPIDPRRCYTAAERDAADRSARRPACPGCEQPMTVQWRPVPGSPLWRPADWRCPTGCIAGIVHQDAA